ncbi:MAG: hypothetical protein EU539_06550 [Promethearchaeota archaeon]|nr:MAG: hypothetical protein EU539_06550 [Candidatus Lokiarchaeota archaeon]
MSKRYKKTKKDDQIFIDEKKGQLYIGDKDLRLLMLRPIDLIEFLEFAGTNADDIVIWVGKTLAKYFMDKLFPGENLAEEDIATKKEIINLVLETFENLGYGLLTSSFQQKTISISVEDPIIMNEKENIMAKNVCILYLGIFNGILDYLEIDAEGKEKACVLLGDKACVFQFDLLGEEFGEESIDHEEKAEHISSFLKSL